MSAAYERVSLLIGRNRYAEAEKELRGVLADDPDDGTAHTLLALCQLNLKRGKEGLESARRGVHLAPDDAFSHYVLALAHDDRDESKKALVAIREAIRLDPEDADYFAALGSLHFQRAAWNDALEAANEGLRLDPEHADCANLKSMTLRKLGQRGAAAHELKSQLARDPLDPDTHANRGWQLLEDGRTKESTQAFREALRLDPENEWAREGLVESIKARNPLYRVVLKYMFFMARQSNGMRWAVIIGAYVLYRVIRRVARDNPDLAPWLMPLIVVYLLFVAMSWFGDHFFNLLLLLHPQGRHALSKEQTRAALAIGVLLGIVCTAAGAWAVLEGDARVLALMAGLYTFCLMIPVSGYFSATRRSPRRRIGILVLAYLAVGVGLLAFGLTGRDIGPFALAWLLLVVTSPWYVNIQLSRR